MDETNEVLVFQVHQQQLGIRSKYIHEVLRAVSLTPVPHAPASIEGALNLRGRIVPVFDIRHLLNAPARRIHPDDYLLVMQAGEHCIAIRVDGGIELTRLAMESGEQTESAAFFDSVARTTQGVAYFFKPARLIEVSGAEAILSGLEQTVATEKAT